jgi:large subunit ribosomal protein L23
MNKDMIIKPRMSEKSYALSATGVYVFDVPMTSNKIEVARAIESQFDVTVKNVKVMIIKGKVARSIRLGARVRTNHTGKRSDFKKAYVTLKDGDSIPVFAALDEQAEKEQKRAEVIAKASEKAEKKESKQSAPKSSKGILGRRSGSKGGDK